MSAVVKYLSGGFYIYICSKKRSKHSFPCFLRSLYNEPLTPTSNPSLSPGGSPLREGPLERSALPSPADWSEFINASNSKVERDLAQLTLSDPEQRELYEAARLVQTAFRKYKVQAWHLVLCALKPINTGPCRLGHSCCTVLFCDLRNSPLVWFQAVEL